MRVLELPTLSVSASQRALGPFPRRRFRVSSSLRDARSFFLGCEPLSTDAQADLVPDAI
jgi:hypothetical protein